MIITRTLRQAGFEDHDLVEACDGVEALKIIQETPPDLVLADWNMPEMSGIELLNELNKTGIEVTFGFVTSEATQEMQDMAEAAGAQFFVTKPFTSDMLRKALDAYAASVDHA
jgi:two-component system chemotaxis response regulator CheY